MPYSAQSELLLPEGSDEHVNVVKRNMPRELCNTWQVLQALRTVMHFEQQKPVPQAFHGMSVLISFTSQLCPWLTFFPIIL